MGQAESTENNPGGRGHNNPKHPLSVVGIGASSGGLEALKKFFAAVTDHRGMAFVIVQHLMPDHDSLLPEILTKHTELPVTTVTNGMPVEADTVYVAPPGQDVSLRDGVLFVTPSSESRGWRHPIDHFFRSLARDQRQNAVAVVLSGNGSDGTLGIREIKECGGMVMVQHPHEAGQDSMPLNAMETGQADYVQPVQELVKSLESYVDHNSLFDDSSVDPLRFHEELSEIQYLLQFHAEYDFRNYKHTTLLRRVQRRMGLAGVANLKEYVHRLKDRPHEIEALAQDLLICVTQFLRNQEVWDVLAEEVLPKLINERRPENPIRVWIPGCATGEEAYTMAMLLSDAIGDRRDIRTQIFATDISNHALKTARAGWYPETIAADIKPEWGRKYFTIDADGYRVTKAIREMVVFASHDLKGDPSFFRLDLISCRNLLIYLEPEAQTQILRKFHFALNPSAYLMLGNSETAGRFEEGFDPVDSRLRIYRRVNEAGVVSPIVHTAPKPQRVSFSRQRVPRPAPPSLREIAAEMFWKATQSVVLVLNDKLQPIYVGGSGERFLKIPEGEQRYTVYELVRPGLHLKLRAAIGRLDNANEARFDRAKVTQSDGSLIDVRGVVRTMADPESHQRLIYIHLEEDRSPRDFETSQLPTERGESSGLVNGDSQEELVTNLERELLETREELSHTIEQLEQANEELRASHEEAMSVNEELQSGTEELEASREELQSLNEELTTLNVQLEDKLSELESANNDLDNLISSTRIAVVFLDTEFRVRNFTPEAIELFSLIRTDIGRPISDLVHKFTDGSFLNDAREVLKLLAPVEREVIAEGNRRFLRRLLPYRTHDNRIEGVVATFQDITQLKHIQDQLSLQREQLSLVADAMPVLIAYIDKDLRYQFANASYERWFGISIDDVVGKPVWDVVGQKAYEVAREKIELVMSGERISWEGELPFRHGSARFVHVEYIPHLDSESTVIGYYALIQDISERYQAEKALQISETRFRNLADNIVQLAWTCDELPNVTWYNRRWYEFTGADFESAQDTGWAESHHPDHIERVFAKLAEAARNETVWEDTFPLRRHDGVYRWFLSRAVPIRDQDGKVVRWFGTNTDITEQMELEQALKDADRRKDEFLAMLAHELRNPLAPIRSGIDLLLMDSQVPQEPLNVMEEQVRHLVRLVDDLLDVSRITRGKVDLRLEVVPLQQILKMAVGTIQPMAEQKNISISVRMAEDPVWLEADPVRLAQVFENLVINGVKYTQEGGSIEVTVIREEESVSISFRDNGIGIDEDLMPRVFELFAQSSRSSDRAPGGLGIGLTIVKSLIELHHGSVAVTSDGHHKGSEFTVSLPILPEGPGEIVEMPKLELHGSHKILIVDDNKSARHLLSRLVAALGNHEIETAGSGMEALESIPTFQPRIVMLDIGLPIMDGYEVARRIRENDPERTILLVAVTGYGQDEDRLHSEAAGFDLHLVKPVGIEDLRQLLGHPKLREE
ncbi:CheR family methyltransferase [Bremerella cremea]|uniref:CheR family methyltransferase n=1 Tax=Bremerella cremea TaxID=1031537 RepID=UPI0031F13BA3